MVSNLRHNEKLQLGEENCFLQLVVKALNLGGNAIIATDIDYSEVGNSKGLLMICASGTAICPK
ncbi:MAG: heavy metal-binding domain-containing protein [Flavobacteriaceae bacterium]